MFGNNVQNILRGDKDSAKCYLQFSVIFILFFCCLCQWGGTMRLNFSASNGPTVHPPYDIWKWRSTADWYWQGKTEELGERSVPLPLCLPRISHGLTRARSWVSTVRGRRLTSWAMSRSSVIFYQQISLVGTFMHTMRVKHNNQIADLLFYSASRLFALHSTGYNVHTYQLETPDTSINDVALLQPGTTQYWSEGKGVGWFCVQIYHPVFSPSLVSRNKQWGWVTE
jgi:hypothetical protein